MKLQILLMKYPIDIGLDIGIIYCSFIFEEIPGIISENYHIKKSFISLWFDHSKDKGILIYLRIICQQSSIYR